MTLNWSALMSKGRCKDLGVPWSPEESEALIAISQATNLSFTEVAPYIRTHGPISVDEFHAIHDAEIGGEKPDVHKTRKELEKKAKALKVDFLPEVGDRTLAEMVRKAEEDAANPPAPAAPAQDPADPVTPDAPAPAPASSEASAPADATDATAPATPPTREDLEKRATALGLTFTDKTKDATLLKNIEKAEEADKSN